MSLRINRLLSDADTGSRREVEKYIVAGRVMLNDERTKLTGIVVEDDAVTLDDEKPPVNDTLHEVLSMKHYLGAQQGDRESREAIREYSSRGGGHPNRPAKSGPKRIRSDRYSDEPREPKGYAKGSRPYKAKGGDAHGRRRDNRGKDFNDDDRW